MKKCINGILYLSLMLSLSGCFGALIGAAAGGTGAYYGKKALSEKTNKESVAIAKKVRREEREKYQKEINDNITNDILIENAVNKKMLSGGLTKVLSVHSAVKNGIINLYGNVPSQAVADRAIDIARRQPGIKKVVNNLVIVEVKISSPKALKASKTVKKIVPNSARTTANPNLRSNAPRAIPRPNSTVPLSKKSYITPNNRGSSVPQIYSKKTSLPSNHDGQPIGSTLTPRGAYDSIR